MHNVDKQYALETC